MTTPLVLSEERVRTASSHSAHSSERSAGVPTTTRVSISVCACVGVSFGILSFVASSDRDLRAGSTVRYRPALIVKID